MNLELLRSVHALEVGKSLKRNLRSSSYELYEARSVGLVEGPQGAPEPLDLLSRKKEKDQTY